MADERKVKVVLQADIADYRRHMADADAATARAATNIDRHGNQITGAAARMVRSAEVNAQAWQTAGVSLATFGATGAIALGLAAKAALDWETAWTGVLKTVDGSPEQLGKLEDALRDMALVKPASAVEIAAVAEAAGQLGVAVDDIASFTSVMVDLGETTNLTSDEAATSIAQLMNVMRTAPEDVDNLGAALVALGNNGASTERDIVQMAQRIGGAGEIIGLTEGEVLGLANALASAGIEVEAGGSAISNIMIDISKAVSSGGDELDEWARVAGMSASEFASAWKSDPAAALATMIEGLGRMNAAGEDVFGTLDALGQSDVRVTRALLSMATSGDMLRKSLTLGNEAWEENSALLVEAEKRYSTTQAKLEMARNGINDAAISIGENLLPVLATLAAGLSTVLEAFSETPDELKDVITVFGVVATAITLVGGAAFLSAPKIVALRDAYRTLAADMPRAAAALRAAGIAAGALGAILTVASVAFGIFASRGAAEAERKAAELADTLDEATGAMTDLTRETVYNNLVNTGAAKAAKDLGIGLDVLTDAALGNEDALAKVNGKLDVYRDASERGNARAKEGLGITQDQIAASTLITEQIGIESRALVDAGASWADKQVAMEADTKATEAATEAAEVFNDTLTEQLELLRDAAGLALDERSAVNQFQAAIDDATDSLEENGITLDANTEQGRANREALDAIATSTWDWIEAGDAAGASTDDLKARMEQGRAEFVNSATQMGLNADEANALADQLGLIPANVTTVVALAGMEYASGQVERFKSLLASIPGSKITSVGVTGPNYFGVDGVATRRATGGPIYGPGTATSDSIPALLSNGEYVQNAAAHSYWGTSVMDALNRRDSQAVLKALSVRGYATGGAVYGAGGRGGAIAAPAPVGGGDTIINFDGARFDNAPPEVVTWLTTAAQRARAMRGA